MPHDYKNHSRLRESATFTQEYGKERVEEIFWDEVGGGRSYEGAMDEVWNWLGNNRVDGVNYDDDTDGSREKWNAFAVSGIPSEKKFLRMKKKQDDANAAEERAEAQAQKDLEDEIVQKNPDFPYTKEAYEDAIERWGSSASYRHEPLPYHEFIEFMTEYLD